MKFKEQVSAKSKFTWNMIGSMSNALSSLILLTTVTRLNGDTDGGIFSLAFSTAQLLTTVSCFETRALQATDVKEEVSFKDYFTFRFITCILMMICAVGYVIMGGHTGVQAAVILIICFYKVIDGISDSFQGMFQQKDRIDLSGQALGIRVIFSTIGFMVVLAFTHNMIAASIAMVVISLVILGMFDFPRSRYFSFPGFQINLEVMKKIFIDSLPLFIGSFMISYVLNASKYAIEAYLPKAMQAHYGFLLMPAFAINLFSLFAFRPMMTTLAISWNNRDFSKFMEIIKRSMLWISFLTVGAVIGAYLLGIYVLNIVSGLDLSAYRIELAIVMLGGGMNAFITVFYYVLTVMRKQMTVLVSYSVGFVSAIILSPILVKTLGISGGAIAYVIPMLIIVCFMWGAMIYNLHQYKKKNEE